MRTERTFIMPEMFDWIFYAIVILPLAVLIWDWRSGR